MSVKQHTLVALVVVVARSRGSLDFLLAGARAIFFLPSRNSRSLPPGRQVSSLCSRSAFKFRRLWPSSVFISEKVIFNLEVGCGEAHAARDRKKDKPKPASFADKWPVRTRDGVLARRPEPAKAKR